MKMTLCAMRMLMGDDAFIPFLSGKFYKHLMTILRNLNIAYTFGLRDFKQRYHESNLGLFWVIVQPLSLLIVIAIVVHFGLRGGGKTETNYLVYLATGYIPWLFFSSSCSQATNVYKKYSYVVKNINIPPALLLCAVFISNIFVHVMLMFIIFCLLFYYGYLPTLSYLHIFYYFIAASVLGFAISLITSSVYVFLRDTEKAVGIVLQFGFWFTPILWDKSNIPSHLKWVIDYNPVAYIVSGYRNAILYQESFGSFGIQGVCFWGMSIFILVIGCLLYKRLSPHFIELL